ncbi:MAG: DUF86 domain-containing protein [Dictyoglomus sp.]|nr:DUF86 domain-containing protein [Dictyoglomus sp.]MDW8188264.1 DUF86 domain-containing protein [Dictyoglomus sp.]
MEKWDMYIDLDLIQRKMEIIEEEISFLKEMQKFNFSEFQEDIRNIKSVCRSFQNSIQVLIDIGNHIVSSLNLGKPEFYEDIPKFLKNSGIITSEFEEKFKRMIRFRNFLVHEYDKIDPSRIYKYLQYNLKDLEEGLKIIVNFLREIKNS